MRHVKDSEADKKITKNVPPRINWEMRRDEGGSGEYEKISRGVV